MLLGHFFLEKQTYLCLHSLNEKHIFINGVVIMNSNRGTLLKSIIIVICTAAAVLWVGNPSVAQSTRGGGGSWGIDKKSERVLKEGSGGLIGNKAALTIVFGTKRDGNEEIYSMSADGSNAQNLTHNPSGDGYPSCSPDGKKIAFVSNRDGNWEIYVMNPDGSNQKNLTNNPADDGYPSWSPDGQKIAFASTRAGKRNIYFMDTNGANLEKITNDPVEAVHPAWSPDGNKIIFASDRYGNREIYVLDLITNKLTNITNNRAYDDYPAWSPDGKEIVFVSDRVSNNATRCDLYIMDFTGSNQRPILTWNSDERHPAWSPDGKDIVFISEKNGVKKTREISIMNKNGANIHPITNNSDEDNHPKFIKLSDKTLISTALVIDRSGSMKGDKLARAKQAVWAYVTAMNPNDLASLSVFSDSSDTKISMTRQDTLIRKLDSSLSEISATNYTNIGAGLDQAYQQMEKISVGPDQKYALLLSDGRNNRGHWRPVVDKFVAKRWPIHTVGFGNNADHKTLREIAKLTRGTYRFADISDIVNVYQEISALAQNKSIVLSFREALAPRGRLSYQVPVSQGTQALNVYTNWQGSRLGTTLISPSGETITPRNLYQSRGRYAQGKAFQMLEINQPQSGRWTINLYWTVPPPATEQVNISVSEKSDIFTNSLGFRSQYARREPVLINIQAAEVVGERRRIPLKNASVTLQIQKPVSQLARMIQSGRIDWSMLLKLLKGNSRKLKLFDDGLHDEYHPRDGIFGNAFKETDENGAYLVTATIAGRKQNGESIKKKLQSSFQVGPIKENKITLSQALRFMGKSSGQLQQLIKDPQKDFNRLLRKQKRRIDRFKRDPAKETERFFKDLFGQ